MLDENVYLAGKTILITGAAGFIGANLASELVKAEPNALVVGLDNLNGYYDVTLKRYRLSQVEKNACNNWRFIEGDLADTDLMNRLFEEHRFSLVVNLAAQAGVRYSIEHPDAYIESNIVGFYNVLEACRRHRVEHLVYASSSSVYGSNAVIPYSVNDKSDSPVSLYAATKKANELMAYAYSKLYDIPSTGLRFFTVYGPAGRPDMAYFKFTDSLLRGREIEIFNYGDCKRDFTYIDDIVEGTIRVIRRAPAREKGADGLPLPPHRVYNIGNSQPENLLDFVEALREELVAADILPADYDLDAHMRLVPMQAGDVPVTYADISDLERDCGFRPQTPLREGLRRFAIWYKSYYLDREGA